eukprot:14194071-Alexandrium_andersonii.AAC.1
MQLDCCVSGAGSECTPTTVKGTRARALNSKCGLQGQWRAHARPASSRPGEAHHTSKPPWAPVSYTHLRAHETSAHL